MKLKIENEELVGYEHDKEAITIPNGITRIGDYAFYGCYILGDVTISDSVTSIGYDAFRGCSQLKYVVIPNSVTSIGDGAFEYCSGLIRITIPDSVTSIGYRAFYGCKWLTVHCNKNSCAERYCIENEIDYEVTE